MDRTSILGDTIDYMKELVERINNLQKEIEISSGQMNVKGIFKDTKAHEIVVRNSPKVCTYALHDLVLLIAMIKLN